MASGGTSESVLPQRGMADSLLTEVDECRRDIRTDYYPMSIGEIASLYESKEIDIQPRFQRFFRWTDVQKTAFVESILLGIPIPPIFVSADEEGVWEVVDGMQRLSTIFQAMGKLSPKHRLDPLKFTRAKYLTQLEGRRWDDLPKPLQLDFRRAKIHVGIILRSGDPRAKYDLFQRLNTGGVHLSEQEVRNCLLVMENEEFFNWLEGLSKYAPFRECVGISERLEDEGYHKELVSRFLIFSTLGEDSLKGMGDLGPFINEKMVAMAGESPEELQKREKVFKDTFTILNKPEIGDAVFKRYNADNSRFQGSFLISPYEVVACGIAHHLNQGASIGQFSEGDILRKVKSMWEDKKLQNISQARRTASNRLQRTISYGRKLFQP